jgi:hypothetical protein
LARRAGQLLALAVAVALAQPAAAFANGDPASHVLPNDVYYPRQSEPSGPVTTALELLLKRTEEAGYPMRVALIAAPADLGTIPQYFERPQEYAEYLAPEVSHESPLLVVMPSGYGVDNAQGRGARTLEDVTPPSGSDGDALGRAAIKAGAALSRAAGHPVEVPEVSGGSGGVLVPLLVLLGMAGLAVLLAVWKRRMAGAVLDSTKRE